LHDNRSDIGIVLSKVRDANSAAHSSSALGLAQFLAATWLDMARRATTFLNGEAKARGYVDSDNNAIVNESNLLALRSDPRLSITTAAEYAKMNQDFLSAASINAADDDEKARLPSLLRFSGRTWSLIRPVHVFLVDIAY
jgi:hypothetical protein